MTNGILSNRTLGWNFVLPYSTTRIVLLSLQHKNNPISSMLEISFCAYAF